ncbi:MAG: STAS domain-containing protein, partial [Clostridia bacterium]|nr:STAS domain-containing protein [Clostridia bacterium]
MSDSLTLKLTGRISSANASEIEEQLRKEADGFTGDLTLDAADLEYISSAGLRVVLRMKKDNSTTKIINCNPETYEIFDMTGFT